MIISSAMPPEKAEAPRNAHHLASNGLEQRLHVEAVGERRSAEGTRTQRGVVHTPDVGVDVDGQMDRILSRRLPSLRKVTVSVVGVEARWHRAPGREKARSRAVAHRARLHLEAVMRP